MRHIKSIASWQKAASYLYDVLIERTGSEINPELYLFLSRGKFKLCTDKAVYSYEDRYDNFRILFDKHWRPDNIKGRDVLILGLGLGSIPILIEKTFPDELWYFTAIEVDEEIIRLAEDYVLHMVNGPLDIYSADAEVYIRTSAATYDLICMDVFINDAIPDEFLLEDFLWDCHDTLNDEGMIIFNTLAYSSEDRRRSQAFYDGVFKKVFSTGRLVHCHHNYMLLGIKFSEKM